MTLEDAVKILNKNRHGGEENFRRTADAWFVKDGRVAGPDYYDWLDEFEAIAIAEKYQNQMSPASLSATNTE